MKKLLIIILEILVLVIIATTINSCKRIQGEKISLEVNGMHCAACIVKIQKALKDVPEVVHVKVDPLHSKATIQVNPSFNDTLSLIDAIQQAGFSAKVN